MGRDFTNFHAGCHGPVPLETTICSENSATHSMISSRARRIPPAGTEPGAQPLLGVLPVFVAFEPPQQHQHVFRRAKELLARDGS